MTETKPRRRWFRFSLRTLLVLVACAAVFAWACLKIRGQVKVSAWLMVRDEFSLSDPQKQRDPVELHAFRDAQVQWLAGPLVRERVTAKLMTKAKPNGFGTQTELQQWIADHLVVSLASGTDLIEITMPGVDPDQAAEIINEVAQADLELFSENKIQAASQKTSLLVEELETNIRRNQSENGSPGDARASVRCDCRRPGAAA